MCQYFAVFGGQCRSSYASNFRLVPQSLNRHSHIYLKFGKMRTATYTDVCEWVSRAQNAVPITVITNGFRKGWNFLWWSFSGKQTSTDDGDVEHHKSNLRADLSPLFNSDSEDEDVRVFQLASDILVFVCMTQFYIFPRIKATRNLNKFLHPPYFKTSRLLNSFTLFVKVN